ncbi:thioredoxin domain-containing protein [Tepidicaulis sp. LMO-SS28]|uniref:thioredoxin domain-containing protein n=1 Tax=Tepidicaulis sp. LMO-SS28 TaxID=3447455 RepID=UPI003EE1364A
MTGNRLAGETSPYLLQHKDNPVHWRPWGPEALADAKETGKPILLSVGYAACHWCHVMAHESFENEDIAALMNEHFVNIKVDREERPDIDAIYMSALHMLGEQGGWPLTMFLTPDGEPFWGGTYFPPEPRYGRPGFPQILAELSRIFREEPEKIENNRAALLQALAARSAKDARATPPADLAERVAGKLLQVMDSENGGIQGAPKFPQTGILTLLWRIHLHTEDSAFSEPVLKALNHMCEGGIYDHLGGGFARYTVDAEWLVPHFEKMLYDNALLLDLLCAAWRVTRSPRYAKRIEETIAWTLREMVAEGGGFAASLDADSEGEEGKFYVWAESEIDEVLGEDSPLFKQAYDVRPEGNWEGKTILNRLHAADAPFDEELEAKLAPLRAKLLARREARIRPGWDDKVLSDWNGLMIAAMARAATLFGRDDWLAGAIRAFGFVTGTMIKDGRLYHAYRAGKLQHRAMADGLAAMTDAAIALNQATGDPAYLEAAEARIAELDAHYWNDAQDGYFFTADDADALITRLRTVHDDATPAANGVLPGLFTKLHALTGKSEYLARADQILSAFAGEAAENAFPLASYLTSLDTRLTLLQAVLIGPVDEVTPFREALQNAKNGDVTVQIVAPGEDLPETHPAFGKKQEEGKPTAYLCRGETCSLPLTDVTAFEDALSRNL